MIRRYCDICGAEMTDATTPAPDPTKSVASRLGHQDAMNAQRFKDGVGLKYGKPKVMFEVVVGLDGAWNAGDICKHCVIDAVNAADDRPTTCELSDG